MTPDQITRAITAARLSLTALEIRLPEVLDAMERRLDEHDGYPATASGSDSSGAGPFVPSGERASTSSTERAGARRAEWNVDRDGDTVMNPLDDVADWVSVLTNTTRRLHALCDQHTGRRLTPGELQAMRCSGLHDPTCLRIADPARVRGTPSAYSDAARLDGQCTECGQQTDAKRRARSDEQRRRRHGASATRTPGT